MNLWSRFGDIYYSKICIWNTTPVDLKLNEDSNRVLLHTYLITKYHEATVKHVEFIVDISIFKYLNYSERGTTKYKHPKPKANRA